MEAMARWTARSAPLMRTITPFRTALSVNSEDSALLLEKGPHGTALWQNEGEQ